VRLRQGNYTDCRDYGNPVEIAYELYLKGFKRLHVVDLDGAKNQCPMNLSTVRRIVEMTHMKVDFGGGIKSMDSLDAAFDAGVSMVTIGSLAVRAPQAFEDMLTMYGKDKIILGADVMNRQIRINGWQESSCIDIMNFIGTYVRMGVKHVLCTDISRDGMLSGPSTELYKEILRRYPNLHLIASGGVSSLDDIKALESAGVPSVVFGKALYEGTIDPLELIRWSKQLY